ncbi:MAG: hypothetical protein D8H91_13215 [Alloprevotella sp.]|nr:MAG: hypothetical protein D8H91_13215 [Alloprevotella sp.]
MQKYELFLKLARVSPKKTQKKCIFGYLGAFSSEKRGDFDAFSRFSCLGLSRKNVSIVVQRNDCAMILEDFDGISMIFRSIYIIILCILKASLGRRTKVKSVHLHTHLYI